MIASRTLVCAASTLASRISPRFQRGNTVRALASGKANGIGRRPILIGGVAGVTTAQMGNLGNQQARAVEAAPAPDTAAMAPAVAAIAALNGREHFVVGIVRP